MTVEIIDGTIVDLAQHMIQTMIDAKGIGLAGVQVGKLLRIFVVQVGDSEPQAFINPEITGTSEETGDYEEGCLSIPGVYADVVRPLALQISYWNLQGKHIIQEADGLLARVIQHENDHLNGKLFYEYLKPGGQKRLLKLYEKRMQT